MSDFNVQESKLSGALQENILTLLCFDDEHCKLIRAAIKPALFESAVFRRVAECAVDFIDQYGEAIKDHLPDHLEDVLKGDDERKARSYRTLLDNLFGSKDSVNSEYVIKQLHKFVRLQNLKSTIIKATEALADNRVDEAEIELEKGMKAQVLAFEPGLDLSTSDALMYVLDHPEEEGFNLGIPELDSRGVIPRRKELFTFMAPRGKGKSWFAIHCAKMAMLSRWSVLIVTLEMSERRYGARFLQSFFSLTRREGVAKIPRLVKDKANALMDISIDELERMALMNPDDRPAIARKVRREFGKRPRIKIKEFPTHALTMPQLEAYLEGLERYENFTPDLIILDYPDLMEMDPKNVRAELQAVTARFRGLGVKRNAAVIALTQPNREGEKATLVTGDQAAEDISKLATADTFITYSQTRAEYKLGLARLFVEKARNEEAKMQVLITQAYSVGQFCLDSLLLDSDYWDLLESRNPETGGRRKRRRDDDDDEEDA